MKDREDKQNRPMIVVYDRATGGIAAHMALCKGTADEWMGGRIVEDIHEFGYAGEKIIVKCDQEPAILRV